MEDSILKSVNKLLGIQEGYTPFNLDVTMHINSVFSVLHDLGIGPDDGFMIEDDTAKWSDFKNSDGEAFPTNQMSMIRTYVFLKVRLVFDPPGTSFLIDAVKAAISEHEFRLSRAREETIPLPFEEVFPRGRSCF